ncbi:unnamed protein product [Ectocarpus sp. CCAP 1310/34]|nr:unnamed protein product [Ectocarpus sp. CCAP 1310/34]
MHVTCAASVTTSGYLQTPLILLVGKHVDPSTAVRGPKRKIAGEAAVGGKKRRPGTAVEASRAAEAALVANYVPG